VQAATLLRDAGADAPVPPTGRLRSVD